MSEKTSLYIHVPFCVRKCGYCDFFSITDTQMMPGYIRALGREIAFYSTPGRDVSTLYFGGGTPSTLRLKDIEILLTKLHDSFRIPPDAEKTIEINPGTVDDFYVRELYNMGFNRVSLGGQSLDDEKLRFLERIHTADQVIETMAAARNAGFERISLDMMYAVPGETKAEWQKDLEKALRLNPSHLSCYMLTLVPGTPMFKSVESGKIFRQASGMLAEFFKLTSHILVKHGYEHYEISSFSKGSDNRSQHNSNYWKMTPYIGFGPSAHSFDKGCRFHNFKDVRRYVETLEAGDMPVAQKETLNEKQKMLETVMLGLRTCDGVDIVDFSDRFKVSFDQKFKDLNDLLQKESLAEQKENRFYLTLQGMVRLDHIVESFAQKIF